MKIQFPLKDFKSSNQSAFLYLLLPAGLCVFGLYLSKNPVFSLGYFISQLFLSIFFFQCFILLHETGHFSFFKSRNLNVLFGHFFAIITIIPFKNWTSMHNLHHRWTGYRDKDPNTEDTVSPKFTLFSKILINVSWKFWLPLFTIGYRYNYWNISKIKRHLPANQLKSVFLNMALLIVLYVLILVFWSPFILKTLAPAYLISLMISDVFILSQHSHIEIPLSNGNEVKPLRYADQIPYTRSLKINQTIARFFYFNFNLHELHHAYPGLPAYHLNKIQKDTPNAVKFSVYLKEAKRMSGLDFVFKTSSKKIGIKDPIKK